MAEEVKQAEGVETLAEAVAVGDQEMPLWVACVETVVKTAHAAQVGGA